MFACLNLLIIIILINNNYGEDVFNNRFTDIRFTPTFIDKTLLIYEVFQFTHLSLNAPYQFGKSSNLGMLSLFLSNLRTKETIIEYFNGTEIWKDETFVKTHMGQYPVILFNSSACRIVHDEDHMMCSFQWIMHNTFSDHSYLVHSKNISIKNKQKLKKYLNLKKSQCVGFKGVRRGLIFLAQLLYTHFGKKVILLVDGFSCGVMERIIEDNDDLRYLSPLVVEYYNDIYNTSLLSQNYISRCIVTSEHLLYGLTDPVLSLFQQINFMEHPKFSMYYGFTYDELEYLLCKFNIPLDERPQVLKWYCGYSTMKNDIKVCNPHSILQYLKSPYKRIRVYWFGSGVGPDLLQRMIEVKTYQEYICNLVYKGSINITLETQDIGESVNILRQRIVHLQPDSQNFIFQLLKETGFLTYGSQQSGLTSLRIPNEEIRFVLDKFLSLLSFI